MKKRDKNVGNQLFFTNLVLKAQKLDFNASLKNYRNCVVDNVNVTYFCIILWDYVWIKYTAVCMKVDFLTVQLVARHIVLVICWITHCWYKC